MTVKPPIELLMVPLAQIISFSNPQWKKIIYFTPLCISRIPTTESTTIPSTTTKETRTTTKKSTQNKKEALAKIRTSFFEQQKLKLQNLLSGPQGDISSVLLQKTVSELQPNLKNLHSMVRLEDALSAGKSAKLVQEDFYVFHTTLVQLQKILEAAESKATPDIRPLLKRTLAHNMSLIGLLFHYIVQSGRSENKEIILEDTRPFWKHYKPLKEVFPFL